MSFPSQIRRQTPHDALFISEFISEISEFSVRAAPYPSQRTSRSPGRRHPCRPHFLQATSLPEHAMQNLDARPYYVMTLARRPVAHSHTNSCRTSLPLPLPTASRPGCHLVTAALTLIVRYRHAKRLLAVRRRRAAQAAVRIYRSRLYSGGTRWRPVDGPIARIAQRITATTGAHTGIACHSRP